MGWKLKAGAFLFALFALGAGAILIAIPIFLWLFWPWIRGARRKQGTDEGKGSRRGGSSWMKYLGFLLIFLSLVAFVSGGSLSPVLFGAAGVGLVLYGRGSGGKMPSWIAPVKDSILLRDRVVPFNWLAVAEVKAAEMDAAKVLPAVNETILVKVDAKASTYLVMNVSAVGENSAEDKILTRLRELSKILVQSGAYLLPLDGQTAISLVKCQAKAVELDLKNLEDSLGSVPYDMIAIGPSGHVVESLGAYQKTEGGHQELVTRPRQALRKPILVWELAKSLEKRVRWPGPDDQTVFLSSLAATRGAGIGERLVENGPGSGTSLLVRSVKTPAVELSRAQLRALVRIYS